MQPGGLIGARYRLEQPVGSGGMGTVFRARELSSGREVAIKTYRLGPDTLALLPRFAREAEALARITHPAIVRYVEHGQSETGEPFLVMEWIAGESLHDCLVARGLSPRDSLELGLRLCEALGAVHEAGVVHRDLKPRNVMLPDGSPRDARLVDFGVARVLDASQLTHTGGYLGTVRYTAPEQIRDARNADVRSDVFSLGCILFECLTAKRAFDGSDLVSVMARILFEPAPHLHEFYPELPAALDELVNRMLARDPAERPASAGALRAELAQILASERDNLVDLPAARPGRVSLLEAYLPTREVSAAGARALLDVPGSQASPAPAPVPRVLAGELVGREVELAQIDAWIDARTSTIVVWGAAGIGKTRVALAVIERAAARSGWDACLFVDLGEARSMHDAVRSIAAECGVVIRGSDTPEVALGRALARRGRVLLVLDRVERLATDVVALSALWERHAPRLTLLITSRIRLATPRGALLELSPLSCRSSEAGTPSPAASLFYRRARAASPGLPAQFAALDGASQQQIEALVRGLDGIPLALELAAARCDVLELRELAARWGEASEAARTARPRLAVMDGAIAWSLELLTPEERRAFRQCAVFRGSFDLRAVEAVLDAPAGASTSEVLLSLRDKSLLARSLREGSSEVRLAMFTPLRDVAAAELAASGEAPALRARHAAYYAALAGRAPAAGPAALAQHFERERDNFVAAFEYALEGGVDAATVFELALGLEPLFVGSVPTPALLGWLDRACAQPGDAAGADLALLRARVLVLRARGSAPIGRRQQAHLDLDAALVLARAAGDRALEGLALLDLGVVHHLERALPEAERCYRAALARLSDGDDLWAQGRCLGNIGALCHDRLELAHAARWYERAIVLLERQGERRTLANFLGNLAALEQELGQRASARERYERAARLLAELGDARLLGITLGNFASLELECGDHTAAIARFERALSLLGGSGDVRSETLGVARLGGALVLAGSLPEGRLQVTRAEHMLVAVADPLAREVLALQRALVELAQAEQALELGDRDEAQTLAQRVRARVLRAGGSHAHALLGEPAPPADGEGVAWAASDDVRTALRLIAPRLAAFNVELGGQGARP